MHKLADIHWDLNPHGKRGIGTRDRDGDKSGGHVPTPMGTTYCHLYKNLLNVGAKIETSFLKYKKISLKSN